MTTTAAQPAEQAQPPAHVSFSQISDWLKCPKFYQLKRLLNLPEKPAVWNIGGHAVHAATEAYDRQHPDCH